VAVMGLSMSGMVTIRSVYTRFVRINLSLNRTSYKLKRYKWLANRWLPCWISTRCRLFSFLMLFVICETYECNVPWWTCLSRCQKSWCFCWIWQSSYLQSLVVVLSL
jgi:hypothetical protein